MRTAFEEVRNRHAFDVVAIVLLPDHLHTVWQLPAGDNKYSLRWRQIKTRFTQEYLAAGGRPGFVSPSKARKCERGIWQRRFYEHTCRDEDDLKRCVDYVHVNPLKHRLVRRVRDWPWSTFHAFVAQGEYAADWGSGEWFGDEFQKWE